MRGRSPLDGASAPACIRTGARADAEVAGARKPLKYSVPVGPIADSGPVQKTQRVVDDEFALPLPSRRPQCAILQLPGLTMLEHLAQFNDWLYHTAAELYYGLRLIYFKWRAKSIDDELNRLHRLFEERTRQRGG